MKTPREILWERHEAAEAKLDALRRKVLETELGRGEAPVAVPRMPAPWWHGFFRDFRGQFAAMSALWVVVAFMRLNSGPSLGAAMPMAREKIPPPQVLLTALRANRLQLLELVEPLEMRSGETPLFIPTRPRSARPNEILVI